MPASVIVGLQWGDEGKGKTTDFLAEQVSTVVRYQGGDNAGHTIVIGDDTFKLHLVPSGVLYGHITPIIGPGVVVNPATLIREFDGLISRGIDISKVRVSHAAHLILPHHVALDKARESALAGDKVGTTQRGIGPAYEDRAARLGLRVEDLLDPASTAARLARVLPEKRALLAALGATDYAEAVDADAVAALIATWGERLRPHIADTNDLVQRAYARKEHLLFEGAQGAMLDLDHGSYPFVTSSNTVAAGACTGLGIAPNRIGEVIGIFKAYTTRVGGGPFPTELNDETGEAMRKVGNEYGSTTGRARRCGWVDLPAMRYACMINGVTQLIMMKADVLSQFDTIRVCTHYKTAAGNTEDLPFDISPSLIEPVYKDLKGWGADLTAMREESSLPSELSDYITYLEEQLETPITVVSVGPDRTQTIERKPAIV